MYLLETTTVHIVALKSLIDNINNIIKTCYLCFNQDGITIKTIDDTKTILLHSFIKKDNFSVYNIRGNGEMKIGIQIIVLYKIIKDAKQNDILTFYVDDATPDTFEIVINHKNISKTSSSMKFIKLNELSFDNIFDQHAYIITIKSSEYQAICKKLLNLDPEAIKIILCDQYVEFNIEGNINMKIEQTNVNPMFKFIKTCEEAHVGEFSARNIQLFNKCSSLSDEIQLQIHNNQPCVIKYNCGTLGFLTLTLSPRIQRKTRN